MTTPTTQLEPVLPGLLPCAFCGSADIRYHGYGNDKEPDHYMQCHNCTTTGPFGANKEAAITAWNTRASAALPFAILPEEMKALERFHECVTDGEGYDVPKETMKQLAKIGLVRRVTANYYEHTNFGLSVLNGDFTLSAIAADRNRREASAGLSDKQILMMAAQCHLPVGSPMHSVPFDDAVITFARALSSRLLPEGWVAVPRNPPKMGSDEDWLLGVRDEFNGSVCNWATIDDIYRSAIAAAPSEVQEKAK